MSMYSCGCIYEDGNNVTYTHKCPECIAMEEVNKERQTMVMSHGLCAFNGTADMILEEELVERIIRNCSSIMNNDYEVAASNSNENIGVAGILFEGIPRVSFNQDAWSEKQGQQRHAKRWKKDLYKHVLNYSENNRVGKYMEHFTHVDKIICMWIKEGFAWEAEDWIHKVYSFCESAGIPVKIIND